LNITPAGLRRKKFAFGIAARLLMRPSMVDTFPPVTRLMTLVVETGPVKIALPELGTLNLSKL
jgi:hypothetical protein